MVRRNQLGLALLLGVTLVVGVLLGFYGPVVVAHVQQRRTLHSVERQVEENPRDANSWLVLGTARFNLQQFDPARTAYGKALDLNSNSLGACQGIAMTYYLQEDYRNARVWFARSLTIAPVYGDAVVEQVRELLDSATRAETVTTGTLGDTEESEKSGSDLKNKN